MQPQRSPLPLLPVAKPALWLAIAFMVISFIGFSDAAFLSFEALAGRVPPCLNGAGCAVVTQSSYSRIAGIPVPVLGAVYYLAIFLGTILYLDHGQARIFALVSFLTVFGFLFSTWFLYVQAFLLKAFCTYCLISAATSYSLFGLAIWYRFQSR